MRFAFLPWFAAVLSFALSVSTALAEPRVWRSEWPNTDFEITTIDNWGEILSGGPPKDGIPAIDKPRFVRASQETRIAGPEPVISLKIGSALARAYPIRYLTWHEIVNDTIAGVPIAVTFCPLCNSAMVFDRSVPEGVLSFGVSGKLRHSDMVMYDRETESWWQQAMGQGIVGTMTGTQLRQLPSHLESWDQFRARHPNGQVMDQPKFRRQYGHNPYRGYDSSTRPFLYRGENPPHGIPPLVRVVRVGERAWPLTRVRSEGGVSEVGVEITWEAGQASALDAQIISESKDVGTVRVRDAFGQDLPHDVMFAFAFHAFWPEGIWMLKP